MRIEQFFGKIKNESHYYTVNTQYLFDFKQHYSILLPQKMYSFTKIYLMHLFLFGTFLELKVEKKIY